MTTENKKLTKEQAEELAAALLASEPRFKDSEFAKVAHVIERVAAVSKPRHYPPIEPNPFVDPASPRYFLYND